VSNKEGGLPAGIKQNLWLIVLAAGLVLTGLLAWALGAGSGEEQARTPSRGSAEEIRLREVLQTAPVAEPPEPGARTVNLIEDYRARIAEEPDHEDVPAWYLAMGNLYMTTFGDYGEAARSYERVVFDFPEWEGARAAYPQLITCYENLGDHMAVLRVYEQMMVHFPDDTQEYDYAREQLGL